MQLSPGRVFGIWVGNLWIWRCQNKWGGPRDLINIVEGSIGGFYALGTVRLHEVLAFQGGFQLRSVVAGAKNGYFG